MVTATPTHLDPDWSDLRTQVRGMLGGRLPTGADAEDVAQEVLLRVFRSGSTLRDEDRFGPWLATMVRNAVADQLRTRVRHPLARTGDDTQSDDAPNASDASSDVARIRLVSALRRFAERLPAIYREVILLSEFDGVPHAEIAGRLDISISGVKSRVQRGRDQLRKMLSQCCEISLDVRQGVVECVPRQSAPDSCCEPTSLSSSGSAKPGC